MNYHNENNTYNFERLSVVNISDLDKLYTVVYNRQPPAGYFTKKYDTAYTGVEYTGFIAYNDRHEPAAYYGVVPCFIKYEGKLILGAQSADILTHPGHLPKDLFAHLARLTFKLCAHEGIKIIFGFPNQNS